MHTLEARQKLSMIAKQQGRTPPSQKGRKRSEETKEKLSLTHKGKQNSPTTQFKKGMVPWNKGTIGIMPHGSNSYQWKSGYIKHPDKRVRKSVEYRKWRETVYLRDDYTCQECGVRGKTLNADHIKPFALFPELRFKVSNGRTLCEDCHKKTETWGMRIQYQQQLYA